VSDRFKVLPQYVLPKQALTNFAGRVAGHRGGAMTTRLIRWFVGKYGVNMDEAANPDIASYPSFNEFFPPPPGKYTQAESGSFSRLPPP